MVAKYCDQRVCMSVCLPVCPLAYLKNHISQLHENFCRSTRYLGRGSILLYALPVLWITPCFHIMGQIQIQVIGELFTVTRQMAPLKMLTRGRNLPSSIALLLCLLFSFHGSVITNGTYSEYGTEPTENIKCHITHFRALRHSSNESVNVLSRVY